ncbi:unnamed protein product [Symbiodinium necroappetens]|uniref:Uncharacterized protein n=1 Tax=Symbiodinium necroappetens TaxID=1628268 RepID=A0A812VL11_9DINO|nr:unnamed protein product [Symbiodinium necroappetens]
MAVSIGKAAGLGHQSPHEAALTAAASVHKAMIEKGVTEEEAVEFASFCSGLAASEVAGCPTDLSLQCGALAIGAVVAKLAAGAQASKESCRDSCLRHKGAGITAMQQLWLGNSSKDANTIASDHFVAMTAMATHEAAEAVALANGFAPRRAAEIGAEEIESQMELHGKAVGLADSMGFHAAFGISERSPCLSVPAEQKGMPHCRQHRPDRLINRYGNLHIHANVWRIARVGSDPTPGAAPAAAAEEATKDVDCRFDASGLAFCSPDVPGGQPSSSPGSIATASVTSVVPNEQYPETSRILSYGQHDARHSAKSLCAVAAGVPQAVDALDAGPRSVKWTYGSLIVFAGLRYRIWVPLFDLADILRRGNRFVAVVGRIDGGFMTWITQAADLQKEDASCKTENKAACFLELAECEIKSLKDRLMMTPPSPALSGPAIHAAILLAHERRIQRLKTVLRGQPWKNCYGQSRRASPSRRCHQRTSEGAHETLETGQLRDCVVGPKEPRRSTPHVRGRKLRRSSRPWRWPRPRSRGRAPWRSRRSVRNEAGQQTLLQSFVLLRFAPVSLRRRAHRKAAGEPHFFQESGPVCPGRQRALCWSRAAAAASVTAWVGGSLAGSIEGEYVAEPSRALSDTFRLFLESCEASLELILFFRGAT